MKNLNPIYLTEAINDDYIEKPEQYPSWHPVRNDSRFDPDGFMQDYDKLDPDKKFYDSKTGEWNFPKWDTPEYKQRAADIRKWYTKRNELRKGYNPKLKDAYNSIERSRNIGKTIGTTAGMTLGGLSGYAIGSELFEKKERNLIKNIIIQSDSPEDCIEKLKQLKTIKGFKYCDTVKRISKKYPDKWKSILAKKINIKNIIAPAVGGITGGVVGGYIGNKLGETIGFNKGVKNAADNFRC